MLLRLLIFALINFGGLAIGSLFTGPGVPSDWYQGLNKAPWTPPGWVFGAAWTTIMICFTIYMAYAWKNVENTNRLLLLFAISVVLNVAWNPIFFGARAVLPALGVIAALTVLIGYFLFGYWSEMKLKSLLVAPYLIWLLIATSLNGYVWLNN